MLLRLRLLVLRKERHFRHQQRLRMQPARRVRERAVSGRGLESVPRHLQAVQQHQLRAGRVSERELLGDVPVLKDAASMEYHTVASSEPASPASLASPASAGDPKRRSRCSVRKNTAHEQQASRG